jgi:putative transposase
MPHGLKRFHRAETLHFLTFSCFHRRPFLETASAKDVAAVFLAETRARHQARIYAYVLMPEHVHLLVNEPPAILLGEWIKVFKQAVSRALKGPREQFWLPRYFDANVRADEGISEVIQYIHRNPVKRGLVSRPEDYRWSSYRHYMTGERGVVEIESEWTARYRSRAAGSEIGHEDLWRDPTHRAQDAR